VRHKWTLAVRRGELRFKNHHPDPRTSRYGQRLEEEILGCRMSGWLTPKLECNKKLQALPCSGATIDELESVEGASGISTSGPRHPDHTSGQPGAQRRGSKLSPLHHLASRMGSQGAVTQALKIPAKIRPPGSVTDWSCRRRHLLAQRRACSPGLS
jgi:hypothetical protein